MRNKTSWYTNTKEGYEKLANIQKCVDELYEKIGGFEAEKLASMHMTAEYSDWEKTNKLFKRIKKITKEIHIDAAKKALEATPEYKAKEEAWDAVRATPEWKAEEEAWEALRKAEKEYEGTVNKYLV